MCLAVDDASIVYNEGDRGRLPIFTELGMTLGHYTRKCFQDVDNVRIIGSRAQTIQVLVLLHNTCYQEGGGGGRKEKKKQITESTNS